MAFNGVSSFYGGSIYRLVTILWTVFLKALVLHALRARKTKAFRKTVRTNVIPNQCYQERKSNKTEFLGAECRAVPPGWIPTPARSRKLLPM